MILIDILDATPFPTGYRIAFLTNFLREPKLRKMEPETGLIRPELKIPMCLSFQRDVFVRDICEVTEQPSNTISRGVSSLECKECLTRQKGTVDTRRQVLNITPKGPGLHAQMMSNFTKAENRMLAGLEEYEQKTLTALLDKIALNVDDWR